MTTHRYAHLCICAEHDPTSLCPVHRPHIAAVTVTDVLAGCRCAVVDLAGRQSVIVELTCPVHGAPAFRSRT